MNTVYHRLTGQRIENVHDDDLPKYITAFWSVNPDQGTIALLGDKVEVIGYRKKLRKAGQDYMDIILSDFLINIRSDKENIIYLDNLLGEVKKHCSQGEFFSALSALEDIQVDTIFTQRLKDRFTKDLGSLIDAYYPGTVLDGLGT